MNKPVAIIETMQITMKGRTIVEKSFLTGSSIESTKQIFEEMKVDLQKSITTKYAGIKTTRKLLDIELKEFNDYFELETYKKERKYLGATWN